jgi:protein-disulfide isomerase
VLTIGSWSHDNLTPSRRAVAQAIAVAVATVASGVALADVAAGFAADDGSPIRSFPAPDRGRMLGLPGLMTLGPADADVTIAEVFDYNCGYCRQAASGLDQMLRDDRSLRLAFVHNPILSPASARAAAAIAAVQELYGTAVAYDLHKRALAAPGRASEATVIDFARASGLHAGRIEGAMAAQTVQNALRSQRQFAMESRLRFTPTFVIGDVAFIGWPGTSSMARFVAEARRCGALQCGAATGGDKH